MTTWNDLAKYAKALADGHTLLVKNRGRWDNLDKNTTQLNLHTEYLIKPKPLELYVVTFNNTDGSVEIKVCSTLYDAERLANSRKNGKVSLFREVQD